MNDVEFDIDVDKVARLARLDLTDEQRAKFKEQLPYILAYVSRLSRVDLSDVDEGAYLTDVTNRFRADEVKACEEEKRRDIIDQFPKKKGDALQVPGIFE